LAGGSVVRGLVINHFLIGIALADVGGNVILGNYIGTDVTGTLALGNRVGILITTSNNTIGGTAAGAGNVISGNLFDGIQIYDNSTGNVVQGNLIGTNASATLNLGNANNGVYLLNASGNTIGGKVAGAANVIAFNGNDGVLVDGGAGNAIQQNSIFGHTSGLGIELVNGGNSNLPFPVLTSATSDGNITTVDGLFQGLPNTAFTLEFFANPVGNPSGFGEGRQFLGFTTVTTNSHGTASFTVTFSIAAPPGQFVAATATDTANNTSTFSATVTVDPGPAAPPGGGASRPLTPTMTTGIIPAGSVQPCPGVASVDRFFAAVMKQPYQLIFARFKHQGPGHDLFGIGEAGVVDLTFYSVGPF
jgi:titin